MYYEWKLIGSVFPTRVMAACGLCVSVTIPDKTEAQAICIGGCYHEMPPDSEF